MLATQARGPECICNTQCKGRFLPRVSELSWGRQGSKLIAKLGELVDSGFRGRCCFNSVIKQDPTSTSGLHIGTHTHSQAFHTKTEWVILLEKNINAMLVAKRNRKD